MLECVTGCFHYNSSNFLDLSLIDPQIIFVFLENHPELIKQYVSDFVSKEAIESWLDLKSLEKFHERLSITSFDGKYFISFFF